MGRALRLDPEQGWHHVMNRGVARQTIFHVAPDGRTFESLLADGFEEFGVEVHAYCLMTNHFHLLVHCPDGGLSSYMQMVSSSYTRYLNRRLGRDGPIFRGRFRSLFVDSERYLSCAGRYIHRNPLDLGRSVELDRYRWSSYRYYCGEQDPPSWVRLSLAAAYGGRDAYRTFVENDPESPTPGSLAWAIAMAVAECEEASLVDRARLDRTVGLVMLDMADQATAAQLEALLAFSTDTAKRRAVRRVRRQLEEHPSLGDLARRALELS